MLFLEKKAMPNTKTLLIKPQNEKEAKLIEELMKKMGIAYEKADEEDLLDYGLGLKMKQAERTKKVGKATILRKLRSR